MIQRFFTIDAFQTCLVDLLGDLDNKKIVVALSGGLDSVVLLHATHALQSQFSFSLRAFHFDHRLCLESKYWSKFCQELCWKFQIPIVSSANGDGSVEKNIEAKARQARYNFFSTSIREDEALLMAHHADDQIESALLFLFQGRSSYVFRQMAAKRKLSYSKENFLIRPFLSFRKKSLLKYAKENKLNWIEDDSNQNTKYERNYIRQEVIPLLKTKWPAVEKIIFQATEAQLERDELLDEYITQEYKKVIRPNRTRVLCKVAPIDLNALSVLQKSLVISVVRLWINQAGGRSPTRRQLLSMYDVLFEQKKKNFSLNWLTHRITLFNGMLYFLHYCPTFVKEAKTINPSPQVVLWSDLKMIFRLSSNNDEDRLNVKILSGGSLQIAWRRGGERFFFQHRHFSQSLKKIYQTKKIPPWERDLIPYLVFKDEVVWVYGIGLAKNYEAKKNDDGLAIDVCFTSSLSSEKQ